MTGRKSILGLALLGALALFAFVAQGAMAKEFTNTTNTKAVTCAPTDPVFEFTDEHCDHYSPGVNGPGWSHKAIEGKTKVEINNHLTGEETSPATLEATVFGVTAKLTASTVTGSGTIENTESGVESEVTVNYTGVTVDSPSGCEVEEPLVVKAKAHGVEDEEGNAGLKFEPAEGTTFIEIPFTGEGCALKGNTFKVTGNAVATGNSTEHIHGSGATSVFNKEDESLRLGLGKASFSSITTTRMDEEGNPIALTTK
jgi:hypothetical protein